MRAASIPARTAPAGLFRSRRLLALAGDARLVEQVRRGNEVAFEVVFERHGAAILGFCRHMLGSREEAEDAVQHTFAAAYRDLQVGAEREIALKPWLFAIARNRCMSLLRARREQPVGDPGPVPTAELADQVEQRAELRRLVADIGELPDEQRAALLLSELGDLSHTEVADMLGCEVHRVKALVFRARSQLIARREARDKPCEVIREQLANLRGGALRRTELRLHLRDCPGCRAYREQVRQQRRMLAAALPVAPTLGLKSSVLAAVGLGGGSAGGAATVAGGFGAATVAKVAVAGALAGGGMMAGEAVLDAERPAVEPAGPAQATGDAAVENAARGRAAETAAGPAEPGVTRRDGPSGSRSDGVTIRRGRGPTAAPPDGAPVRRGPDAARPNGAPVRRGPVTAPPDGTPVRRGPSWKGLQERSANGEANAKGRAHSAPNGNGRTSPAPGAGGGTNSAPTAGGGTDSAPLRRAGGKPAPKVKSRSNAGSQPKAGAELAPEPDAGAAP